MFAYNISIMRSQPRVTSVVKAAVLELSRIKNLQLSRGHMPIENYQEIIRLLDAPAPLLKTAKLVVEPSQGGSLSVNLFAGISPRLTRLSLSGWRFRHAQLPVATNLRVLKLSNSPTDSKMPVDHLISVLSTMAQLQTLHVIDSLGRPQGVTVNPPAQQAKLPQLTDLAVDSPLSTCIFLFDHIVSPNFIRVSAKYRTDSAGVDSDISLVRGFAESLGQRVSGPIRWVKLHAHNIKASRSLHSSSSSVDPPPDLHISLPALLQLEAVARCFVHSLALTRVEIVYLDWDSSAQLLRTYLGDLGHLTTIIAGKDATVGLVRALAVDLSETRSATDSGSADLKFLALETLRLVQWNFEDMHWPRDTVFEMLLTSLTERKKAGFPLAKLIVDACRHVEEELHVVPLRAVVGNIEWDGQTIYTSESESEEEHSDDEHYYQW
ncbi:hypothetical protein DXG03_001266 [Asterophora parasitica]|uniref:Uncharacterized protein n=1 Tax=Asterophora parasitica TaxID=117018 RepID=A0A9P7K9C1_9AGAR|nr:hypothetical protein DXG03_001266 [Asterophora parasitica]